MRQLLKMSSLAGLFDKYEAVVPQFKVIERKPIPSQESDEIADADASTKKGESVADSAKNGDRPQRTRPAKPRGRKSRDPRETRTVFVGNIPSSCTKKQIQRLFKTCGKVESVRVRCLQVEKGKLPKKIAVRTHKQLAEESTFNAYVVFSSEEEAEKSLKLNGSLLSGRHLRVDVVAKKPNEIKMEETRSSVFVGNLPFTADEEKLRSCFTDCGNVESVRIIRDTKTGIGKGFGFVTFSDKSGVMFAVRQNKKVEMDGRKLRVFKSVDEQTLKLQKQAKFSGVKSDRVAGPKFVKKHTQTFGNNPRTGAKLKSKSSSSTRQRTQNLMSTRNKTGSHVQRKIPNK